MTDQMPLDQLAEALDRTFADGTRRAVLLLGAGLHRYLAGRRGKDAPAKVGALSDWNALLAAAATREDGVREFEASPHKDPTSTWESMVVARVAVDLSRSASDHEAVLKRRVKALIEGATPDAAVDPATQELGRQLAARGFRDLVTLNFDATLDAALADATRKPRKIVLGASGAAPGTPANGERASGKRTGDLAEYRSRFHVHVGPTRIWHPHGAARRAQADSIQLGLVDYTKSSAAVADAVVRYRIARRAWRGLRHSVPPPEQWSAEEVAEWLTHARSLDAPSPSWVDQAMSGDLIVLGCGLDRAEADLWLLLHERQRQFARAPEGTRPRTFYLHADQGFPEHLGSGPAGVIPVRLPDHGEAWKLVLGG